MISRKKIFRNDYSSMVFIRCIFKHIVTFMFDFTIFFLGQCKIQSELFLSDGQNLTDLFSSIFQLIKFYNHHGQRSVCPNLKQNVQRRKKKSSISNLQLCMENYHQSFNPPSDPGPIFTRQLLYLRQY